MVGVFLHPKSKYEEEKPMDLTMFSLTVDYDGNTLLTTLPCDPYELEDQLGSIGLAHSQDTLRFDAIPNVCSVHCET